MALYTVIFKSPAPLVEHFSGVSSIHLHFRIFYGTLYRHEIIQALFTILEIMNSHIFYEILKKLLSRI
jgi:hypothetical protein